MNDFDMGYYKLVGKKIVPCTLMEWATEGHRHLAQSTYRHYWVSTIFMGISMHGGLFETMIFYKRRGRGDSQSDIWCRRAHTYDKAMKNHMEGLNAAKTRQLMRGQKRSHTRKQGWKLLSKFTKKEEGRNER